MAFKSDADAAASRKATAALMGLAQREGIFVATTDHYDLSPAVAGRAPLVLNRFNALVAAPDLVLVGGTAEAVMAIGVEVECRTLARAFPGASFVAAAKLGATLEIDLSASVYARAIRGSDYDQDASWRQRDIGEIISALEAGDLHHMATERGRLLILHPGDLRHLSELWARLRRHPG